MIYNGLFTIIIWLLKAFNFIIPNWNLPDVVYTNFIDVMTPFYQLNFLIPVDVLIQMFILFVVFEIVLLTIRLGSGFISLVRGGGAIDI